MSATKFIDESRANVNSTTWASYYPNEMPPITPHMEEIAAKLKVAVAKLAEFATPDQLAAFLANQGATGHRQDTSGCVLSKWLQKAIGYEHITVGHGIGLHFHGAMAVLRTPPMLTLFYRAFDQGRYPALLAL